MRGASAQVLWGRAHEARGAPPYWPWVQAIRSYIAPTEPETLRSQLGSMWMRKGVLVGLRPRF